MFKVYFLCIFQLFLTVFKADYTIKTYFEMVFKPVLKHFKIYFESCLRIK